MKQLPPCTYFINEKFQSSGIFGPIDEREESDGPLSMKLQSPTSAAANPEASASDELNNNSTRSDIYISSVISGANILNFKFVPNIMVNACLQ